MPKVSDSLADLSQSMARLSQRAKEAEDRSAEAVAQMRQQALAQNRQQLEARIAEIRSTAEHRRQDNAAHLAETKEEAALGFASLRAHVHDQFEKMHAKIETLHDEHDVSVAQRRAEWSETYALDAVDFAYDAVMEAEAAVLEAADLRSISDAKTAS